MVSTTTKSQHKSTDGSNRNEQVFWYSSELKWNTRYLSRQDSHGVFNYATLCIPLIHHKLTETWQIFNNSQENKHADSLSLFCCYLKHRKSGFQKVCAKLNWVFSCRPMPRLLCSSESFTLLRENSQQLGRVNYTSMPTKLFFFIILFDYLFVLVLFVCFGFVVVVKDNWGRRNSRPEHATLAPSGVM